MLALFVLPYLCARLVRLTSRLSWEMAEFWFFGSLTSSPVFFRFPVTAWVGKHEKVKRERENSEHEKVKRIEKNKSII